MPEGANRKYSPVRLIEAEEELFRYFPGMSILESRTFLVQFHRATY